MNGYKHGRGIAIYPVKSASYEGEFRWNKKHGTGKYEKDNYSYHGFWKKDVKWGYGIEIIKS